jgi:taspase, threonine aspartase, 1
VSAMGAVKKAISVLEDEKCLNAGKRPKAHYSPTAQLSTLAGYGSNLTTNGQVECDAAIMDGRTGDFGSVGALSGDSIQIDFNRVHS